MKPSCVSITRLLSHASWTELEKPMKARTYHAVSAPKVNTSALIFHRSGDEFSHLLVSMPTINLSFITRDLPPTSVHARSSMVSLLGRYDINDLQSRGGLSKKAYCTMVSPREYLSTLACPSRSCQHRRSFADPSLVVVEGRAYP